jgi:hypothetical protein
MKKEMRQYDDDDGRVICSMDVDGMPRRAGLPQRTIDSAVETPNTGDPLTRSEARRFTASALMAVLLIGTVFSATWILFTLFLTQIMFR